MKNIALFIGILLLSSPALNAQKSNVDLNHWKLELPSGYKASDWKLSNFQKDRFAKPFFHLDSLDSSIVMEAYPAEGTSKAKYTRNTLREQMQPGSNDVNWTMKEGGVLEAEFEVLEMSKDATGKYHRTILFQVDGRTTAKQTEQLGLEKPVSLPLLKVYWQNGEIVVARKLLKDESVVGDAILSKSAWKEAKAVYATERADFAKTKIRIEVKKGAITIQVNDSKPILFRDLSVSQWYFENYFTAGNYLQTKDEHAKCVVKFHQLVVSHDGGKKLKKKN